MFIVSILNKYLLPYFAIESVPVFHHYVLLNTT